MQSVLSFHLVNVCVWDTLCTNYFSVSHCSSAANIWLTALRQESLKQLKSPFLHAPSWVKKQKGYDSWYAVQTSIIFYVSWSPGTWNAQCYPTVGLTAISIAHFKDSISVFLLFLFCSSSGSQSYPHSTATTLLSCLLFIPLLLFKFPNSPLFPLSPFSGLPENHYSSE